MNISLHTKKTNCGILHNGNCTNTFLTSKYFYNNVLLRTMLSKVATKAAKIGSEMVSVTGSEIQRHYSHYVITGKESEQDTSKTNHPTGVEISCDTHDCKTRNCAKDISECDIESQKAKIGFHLTHSTKGVEKDKVTTELKTKEGNSVYAVMHKEKEHVENVYDEYSHKDTMMVQQDVNIKALQEAQQKQTQDTTNEKDQ